MVVPTSSVNVMLPKLKYLKATPYAWRLFRRRTELT